jgi:hypothetical protein
MRTALRALWSILASFWVVLRDDVKGTWSREGVRSTWEGSAMAETEEKEKTKVEGAKKVLAVRTRIRCEKCGMRIRGANHESGAAHRGVAPKRKR